MFKNFKPINDNILVELEPKETKTDGGIIIPFDARDKPTKATVVHPGKSTQLCFGEKVFFKRFMGTPLDENYLVLREEDIIGIL